MHCKQTTLVRHLFAAGAFGLTAMTAGLAGAQEPQKVEKIEVTGSNIKRVDAETSAPIQIINRAEIESIASIDVARRKCTQHRPLPVKLRFDHDHDLLPVPC